MDDESSQKPTSNNRDADADEIREEIAALRRDIGQQWSELRDESSAVFDWKRAVVRSLPMLAVGAVIGWAIVSKGTRRKESLASQAPGRAGRTLRTVSPTSSLGGAIMRGMASTAIAWAIDRALQSMTQTTETQHPNGASDPLPVRRAGKLETHTRWTRNGGSFRGNHSSNE